MQKKLLDYVFCPICRHELLLKKENLLCKGCKRKFTIDNGIPVLIDLKNAPNYLAHQISYFEKEDKTRPKYILDEWQKSYLKRFYDNVAVNNQSLVLDIGTGSGYMAVELAKRGAIVISSDLTIAQLHKLAKVIKGNKLENRLFPVCCSAELLPFKTNIADVVIENALLEHLPKEKDAIEEITRVCKKNASVMISVPFAYLRLWPFLIPINIWHDRRIGHLRRYTAASLKEKMSQFTAKKIYYSGHLIKFLFFLSRFIIKTKKFDRFVEEIDDKFKSVPYGGTVLTIFFQKK